MGRYEWAKGLDQARQEEEKTRKAHARLTRPIEGTQQGPDVHSSCVVRHAAALPPVQDTGGPEQEALRPDSG